MSAPLGHPRRTAFSPAEPHPTGDEVVGTYVHSYDPSRQQQSQIPAMRPAQDPSAGTSATPIYDALYSEYRRSFRALPGDRSGEENLRFPAFSAGFFASRAPLPGHPSPPGSARQTGTGGGQSHHTGTLGSWQRVGRHAGRPRPAALPPGSRES